MSERELVEDFTLAPVPDDYVMPGRQIMLIIFALGFSLPVFALGAEVVQSLGLMRGVIACFCGCLLSAVIGIGPAIVGSRVRLSSYVIMPIAFGRGGGGLINLILAMILLGWFANVADMLGTAVSASLATQYGISPGSFACSAIAIVMMTLTGIFGVRTMERFSAITVPLLCLFMGWVLWLAFGRATFAHAIAMPGDGLLTMSHAVSAVIGLVILMAVLMPDFTRYAGSARAALMPLSSIGIGYPLIMMMGAVPAALLDQADIMRIVIMLGVPGLALCVLILSTWVSNTGNLYCATLTLSALLPRRPVWQLGVGGAVVALVAAWFHVSTRFVPFLELLGVAATPIAAVYTCTYFMAAGGGNLDSVQRLGAGNSLKNTLIWFSGALIGYFSQHRDGFLVPAPALEGYATTVLIWFAASGFDRVRPRNE